MTLAPLLDASLAIRIHVASVLPAALLGAYLLLAAKGTPLHRRLGRVWLSLMALSAASSFFIHSIDLFYGFSPIHLLSAYVLYGVFSAYRAARQGRIAAHRRQVKGLYFGGIVGAGAFTFLPGRIMHALVWTDGASPDAVLRGLLFLTLSLALCGLLYLMLGRGTARRPTERI